MSGFSWLSLRCWNFSWNRLCSLGENMLVMKTFEMRLFLVLSSGNLVLLQLSVITRSCCFLSGCTVLGPLHHPSCPPGGVLVYCLTAPVCHLSAGCWLELQFHYLLPYCFTQWYIWTYLSSSKDACMHPCIARVVVERIFCNALRCVAFYWRDQLI